MGDQAALSNSIQNWNTFFSFFGLRPADLEPKQSIVIIQEVVIVVVLCSVTVLQVFSTDYKALVLDDDEVTRVVHMVGNGIVCLLVVLSNLGNKACTRIQKRFVYLERYCSYIEMPRMWRYLFMPFVATIFFISMDVAQHIYWKYHLDPIDIVPTISGHCLEIFNTLYVVQWSVHLFWLRRIFVVVNMELGRLQASVKDFYESELNMEDSQITHPSKRQRKSYMEKLKFCRSLYQESYQLCQQLNETFATRNFVVVSFNFLVGIIFLYPAICDTVRVVANQMKMAGNDEDNTIEHIVFHCKWSIISFINIYSMILACRMTSSEASSAVIHIYRILSYPVDQDLKTELRCFALQMNRNVKFSPHGLFTLNNKLFLSIIATFASYLVVLIQLRI